MHCLGDILAKPCLLSEPLPPQSADGMPADLDWSHFTVDVSLAGGDDVGRLSEAEGVLDYELAFQDFFMAFCEAFFSGQRVRYHACVEGIEELVLLTGACSICCALAAPSMVV